MKTVYLLRHGETEAISPHRFIGQMEVALTARGRTQMEQLAAFFHDVRIDRLVSSPLGRCLEGAEIIGRFLGVEPELEPSLREIDLGRWEGLTVAQVQERYPGSYEARGRDIAAFRPEDGESFADLRDRVWLTFSAILQGSADKTVIVAHAGVNRVLLCQLLDIPLARLFCLPQEYACLNVISWRSDSVQIELMKGAISPRSGLFW